MSSFSDDLYDAVENGDIAIVTALLARYPELKGELRACLRAAAMNDNVEMVSTLVKGGADINEPKGKRGPEGVIDTAACAGAINVVEWLLVHGAKINHEVEGTRRCLALSGAASQGHLDVVKLLVERGGADVNATWAGENPLSFALMFGRKDIEEYLRSKGAVEPQRLSVASRPAAGNPIVEHIKKHFDTPESLSLQEILPSEPSIAIHAVRMDDVLVLATSGMSDQAMSVPDGAEDFLFAELVMYLPPNWPLGHEALEHDSYFWPYQWIRRIALHPHENETWLGGSVAVFSNGEPPEPLGPNTQMSCFLVLLETGELACLELPDGRRVLFYCLIPLYTEERDLHEKFGTEHLLQLFQRHGVKKSVDVARPNVAQLE